MNLEEEFLNDVSTNIKTHKKVDSKKRINSKKKKKGNHGELECVHILNDRFVGHTFARSVQSGAYTGGLNRGRAAALTEEQMLVFSGDIRVPKDFKFTIEHKAYASANFWDLFNDSSDLHAWMKQAQSDADAVGKKPMLVVKYNFHERIVFLADLNSDFPIPSVFTTMFNNKKWSCFYLKELLKMPNSFFFEES